MAPPFEHWRHPRAAIESLAALALILLCGCSHGLTGLYGEAPVSPSPAVPWTPPARLASSAAPASPPAAIPPELLTSPAPWTLGDIVDIALRNSSLTREAWHAARAAAAAYASERGGYFPEIDLNADYNRQKPATSAGGTQAEQRWESGSLDLNWLLLDFGGRRASIEESRQALVAANWGQNAAIQGVILDVEQAYFQHSAARALLAAEEASVQEAQASLDAAQARHTAGIATIADVLQARTALSQAQLALDEIRGQIETTRGALATAMGLMADTDFEVEIAEGPPPLESIAEEVEIYLRRAQALRPDLAAARAEAEQAKAHVRNVRADALPSIHATGSLGRVYLHSPADEQNTYSASLLLQWPLFAGFSHYFDVRRAQADAERARARLAGMEQAVGLQVWTSYYALKTAEQRLRTSADLLQSATENHDVAAGRYQAGVGTILDLLTAQAALENARAVLVMARADWYLAVAQLAHDTGTLAPPAGRIPPPGKDEKP